MAPPLFLRAIEESAVSSWIRDSQSPFGYWFILTIHAIGMGVLVGASTVLDLRLLGVARDFARAAAWYRKAAEQGDARAQTNLGGMYGNGQGVARDYVQAAVWYRKAAEQGDPIAQFNLGLAYAKGRGVAQDKIQAATWYRKAAEQGFAPAKTELDAMTSSGNAGT